MLDELPEEESAVALHVAVKKTFAYLIPIEKFVRRHPNGPWLASEPLTKAGIVEHLIKQGVPQSMALAYIKDRDYLRADEIGVLPGKNPIVKEADGRLVLNLWVRPNITPAPGPWPRIDRIITWLTNEEPEGRIWFLHWLAAKVQDPLFLPRVAAVFGTEQHGGKDSLFRIIAEMLGPQNCAAADRGALENKFNSRWAGKLFVYANEVLSRENLKDVSDRLKILIDGNEIEWEGKGRDQRMIKNYAAWMFASNDTVTPVMVERSDRRYSVFANHRTPSLEYKATVDSLYDNSNGVSAYTPGALAEIQGFMDYLLKFEVDRKLIRVPYKNESRTELIEASLSSYEQFFRKVDADGIDELIESIPIHEWTRRHGNVATSEFDFGERGVAIQLVYDAYVSFCVRSGFKPLAINKFGAAVRNRPGGGWKKSTVLAAAAGKKRQVTVYVGVPRTSIVEEDAPTSGT